MGEKERGERERWGKTWERDVGRRDGGKRWGKDMRERHGERDGGERDKGRA